MWVKRFLYEALVGCKAGQQTTWLLKCTKGVWEGQVGICSPVAASAPVLAQPKAKGMHENVDVSDKVIRNAIINYYLLQRVYLV